jgi:DNA/RNA endonuclease G (NUC1)
MKLYKLLLLVLVALVGSSFAQIVEIQHVGFTIFYDIAQKNTKFSEYEVSKIKQLKKQKRHSTKYDPLISSEFQNGGSCYNNTPNYDIGHLVPFADFCYNNSTGAGVNIWTNMVLQNSSLNRGAWGSLESWISLNFDNYSDKKIVIVGCDYSTKRINKVILPQLFWKVVIFKKDTLYFEFPNVKPINKDFFKYLEPPEKMRKRMEYVKVLKLSSKKLVL